MTNVSLDLVPEVCRPPEVERVLAEAGELRTQLRAANEKLAALQSGLEAAEIRDVADAAAKIRAGSSPGAISSTIEKTRHAIEVQKRQTSALGLASDACQVDLATSMHDHSDEWLVALDEAQEAARKRAGEALSAFEQELADLAKAAAASLWVRGAVGDGRWDRPQRQAVVGTVAPSSEKHAVNGQAFAAGDVVRWARELVDPPPRRPVLHGQLSSSE